MKTRYGRCWVMLVEQCSQLCALVSIVDTKQSKDTCQMSFDSSKFNPHQFCNF